jgi:hypothetical protein
MKHTFYSDPGHGWLAVPREELINLGILHKITDYSYQRGKTVYLEEDLDMSTYARAILATGQNFQYKSAPPVKGNSKIRGYHSVSMSPWEFQRSKLNDQSKVEQGNQESLGI